MKRRLEPELLDALPADDDAAIGSRRDLARINLAMGQHAIMAQALRTFPQPRLLIDLGGGDGKFLLGVARRLRWRGVRAVVADRQAIVSPATRGGFAALGWECEIRQGDVFETMAALVGQIDALIMANLFLHHLDDAALARLFALTAARGASLVACEPRRGRLVLWASHLVFALGANAVSRHDAVASVRAGFAGRELSALWPATGWALVERRALPFSHLFTARRHGI